jgi:hypothetical protein
VQKCVTFSISKRANLLERLMAVPEGAGNLLDNCGILAFTECTEGRSHNAHEQPGIPMLVAGRAGGSLVYPGSTTNLRSRATPPARPRARTRLAGSGERGSGAKVVRGRRIRLERRSDVEG